MGQWGRCCIVDLFVSKLLQNFSHTAAPVRVGLNYHLDIFPGDVRKGLNAIYGIGMTSNTPRTRLKSLSIVAMANLWSSAIWNWYASSKSKRILSEKGLARFSFVSSQEHLKKNIRVSQKHYRHSAALCWSSTALYSSFNSDKPPSQQKLKFPKALGSWCFFVKKSMKSTTSFFKCSGSLLNLTSMGSVFI